MLNMEKKLYPFKFIPVASRKPWGGNALVNELKKKFVECDAEGNEVQISADEVIGVSWELADIGIEDSVVANGWLAGNTISDLMETYLERIVGEKVYNCYAEPLGTCWHRPGKKVKGKLEAEKKAEGGLPL